MSANRTYKSSGKRAPSKNSRVVKNAQSAALPVGRRLSVSGRTATDAHKTFSFAVLSASQQMRERNQTYRFFSID